MPENKSKAQQAPMPEEFTKETVETVCRIDGNHEVIGVMYLEKSFLKMCTVPENISQGLTTKLPVLTEAIRLALGEIDVLDELLVFRIETRALEIMAAPAGDNIACVVHRMRNKKRKQKKH